MTAGSHSSTSHSLGRRERRKLEVRARIFAVARELFAKQGFEATTVDEIARAADVVPATFFNHFQSKQALLGLMTGLEHLSARMTATQRAAAAAAINSGIAYLQDTQTDDGWPAEMVYGVFNRNCMINYDNYRYYFPLWALARHARLDKAGHHHPG